MTDIGRGLIFGLGVTLVLVGTPPLSLIFGGGAILVAVIDHIYHRFER